MRRSLFLTAVAMTLLASLMKSTQAISLQQSRQEIINQIQQMEQPVTLAQLKAEAEVENSTGGSFWDILKKIFNRLFGPDERPPAPPLYEVMGTDITLISANKHAEGKGAGGG